MKEAVWEELEGGMQGRVVLRACRQSRWQERRANMGF